MAISNIDNIADWGLSDKQIAAYPTVYRDDLLAGKTVFVAEAGGAIGRAIAFLCARLGAELMIGGPEQDKLDATAQSIKHYLGRDIHTAVIVSHDPETIDKALARLWQLSGKLDILVNSESAAPVPQNAIDISVDDWKQAVESKLNGAWYRMQKAAQCWRDYGQAGSIVNLVADIWRGMPGAAHESATGAGVVFAGRSLAVEWAPYNIRVNAIALGTLARADVTITAAELEQLQRSNPLLRCGDVMDIAEAVVYLGAPSAKFITGECLTVDGGQRLWGEVWPNGKAEYFNTP